MRFGNPSKSARVVSSTRGHHIDFPGKGSVEADKVPPGAVLDGDKTVYVHVPPALHQEALSAGLLPEDEMAEADAPKGATKPEDPEKLREQVFEAFDVMVMTADRESFAGNGFPKAAAVEKLLGYSLTNGEIKEFWNKFQLTRADK